MACSYCSFHGECQIWEEDFPTTGATSDGYCVVEDDPDPSASCEHYDSLYDDDEDIW